MRIEDVNRTLEEFGDEPVRQPHLLFSQRGWRALQKVQPEKVLMEPVVILDEALD